MKSQEGYQPMINAISYIDAAKELGVQPNTIRMATSRGLFTLMYSRGKHQHIPLEQVKLFKNKKRISFDLLSENEREEWYRVKVEIETRKPVANNSDTKYSLDDITPIAARKIANEIISSSLETGTPITITVAQKKTNDTNNSDLKDSNTLFDIYFKGTSSSKSTSNIKTTQINEDSSILDTLGKAVKPDAFMFCVGVLILVLGTSWLVSKLGEQIAFDIQEKVVLNPEYPYRDKLNDAAKEVYATSKDKTSDEIIALSLKITEDELVA